MKQAELDLWHLTDNKKCQPPLHSLTRVWASLTGDDQETVTKLLVAVMWKKRLNPVIYIPNKADLEVNHDNPLAEHMFLGAMRRDALKTATNDSSSCLIRMGELFEVLDEQGVSYPVGLNKPKRKILKNRQRVKSVMSKNPFVQLSDEIYQYLWCSPERSIFEKLTSETRLAEVKEKFCDEIFDDKGMLIYHTKSKHPKVKIKITGIPVSETKLKAMIMVSIVDELTSGPKKSG